MPTPTALLKFTAKAVLHVLDSSPAGEPPTADANLLAEIIWVWWGQPRDPEARRAEILNLALVPSAELKRTAKQVLREVAGHRTIEVQQGLAAYLSRVLSAVRRVTRPARDAQGNPVPPPLRLTQAADLLAFLPERLPPYPADEDSAGGRSGSVVLSGGPDSFAPPSGVTVARKEASGPASITEGTAVAAPPAADSGTSGRIRLLVTAGPHKGQTFTFSGHDTFLVGRSRRAHFQLPAKDKFFSRIHFLVEVNPPRCRLLDMGSRNGTYVNDQRVEGATELHDGDKIQAGRTVLRLQAEGPAVGEEPAGPMPETITVAAAPLPTTNVVAGPHPALPPEALGKCRVCLTPVPDGTPPPPHGIPLCPACFEKSCQCAQPVTGYQMVRELGKGGMGVVYLALRLADASVVAVKTTIPAVAGTATQLERFLREARILEQLRHPNIVSFREMGESNGQLYFAMDYVPGTDAGRLLKKEGPLPVGRALGLIGPLLEALEYAHDNRFVHRDIKPGNLLVYPDNGYERVKLADFGLARAYQASQLSGLTVMGEMGGTVAFMAPEQITHYREAKPPVDQYAAAATLYNLLTASFIYDLHKNIQQQLLKILQEEPVPIVQRRPDLPAGLAQAIHKALKREPAERFPDVKAFRKALLKFA